MCKNCDLKDKKTKGGYLCRVFDGIQDPKKGCPPSLISLVRRA